MARVDQGRPQAKIYDRRKLVLRYAVDRGFAVQWKVEPRFVDDFALPGAKDAKTETTVTLAEGVPNTKHTLEISGGPDHAITAVRIFQPPLGRK